MAQQICDLNIRKTCNKQYTLPNTPPEQDDRSQHPITSDHIPKSPSITSQEGEDAEKFIHQTHGTQINESDYLLPNTPKHDTNKENEAEIALRQDLDKDSITSFRTIHSKIAPREHSTHSPDREILPLQKMQNIMLT